MDYCKNSYFMIKAIMQTKPLWEIAQYINWRAFKPKEREEQGLPIIRIQNLNNKDAIPNYTTKQFEDRYLVKKWDLLFARSWTLWAYIWHGDDARLNQHIFKVVPNEWINKKYLYYSLVSIIDQIYSRTHGSGMVHITKPEFLSTNIPLPSLPTQQAIAAKLDAIQELIDHKKQSIAKTDELAKAIFVDMFGDLVINEKWREERIFTDVVVLKRWHDLPKQDRKEWKYPVIASTNIVWHHNEYKAKWPWIVTGRSGSIWEVQYIEWDYRPLNTSLYSQDLKGNSPMYVMFFLRFFKLDRYARWAGVPTLNRNLFNTELVPLPPLPLQEQFADAVSQLQQVQNDNKLALAKLEELFASTMQACFQ